MERDEASSPAIAGSVYFRRNLRFAKVVLHPREVSLITNDETWRRLYRLLAARRVAGIALSFGGTILSARLLPAVDYGLYLTASGFFDLALRFSIPGLAERMLRTDENELDTTSREAMAIAGVLGAAAASVATALWLLWKATAMAGIAWFPAALLFATLPVWSCTTIARSSLERRMRVQTLLAVELGGQVAFVAGTAAWALLVQRNLAAPVAGWCLQSLVVCGGTLRLARVMPRLPALPRARRIVFDGAALLGACQIWHLRNLVLPFVVAPTAGLRALAALQLSLRVVDRAQFLSQAHWRFVAIAAPQWRHDRAAIAKLLSEFALVPAVLVGACFFVVAACPDEVVVALFGRGWEGVAGYLPGLAGAALFYIVGSSYTGVLVAERRLRELSTYHALNVALLAGGTALLAPRLGGLAFVEASLVSNLAFVYLVNRFPNELPLKTRCFMILLVLALASTFGIRSWGGWALVPLTAALFVPDVRATLLRAIGDLFRRPGSARK